MRSECVCMRIFYNSISTRRQKIVFIIIREICSIDDMIPKFMFPPNNNTVPFVKFRNCSQATQRKNTQNTKHKVICTIVESLSTFDDVARFCEMKMKMWKGAYAKAMQSALPVPDYSMRFIIKRLVIVDVCLTISFWIWTDENRGVPNAPNCVRDKYVKLSCRGHRLHCI